MVAGIGSSYETRATVTLRAAHPVIYKPYGIRYNAECMLVTEGIGLSHFLQRIAKRQGIDIENLFQIRTQGPAS